MITYVLVHAGWDGGWSWCQAAGYEYREASWITGLCWTISRRWLLSYFPRVENRHGDFSQW